MDPKRFTTISEQAHKEWLSGVTDIPVNENLGIDLLDEISGVELKGKYARCNSLDAEKILTCGKTFAARVKTALFHFLFRRKNK